MIFILYHISVTHKNSCIKHDTFGIKGIRPLHYWNRKKVTNSNIKLFCMNNLYKLQCVPAPYIITMKTYGSEKSPYFPDVPPLHKREWNHL